MSDVIVANVSRMFAHREPWDCSNSAANLGDQVGRLTWQCATEVARNHAAWLLSDLADACEGMRDWARDTGAWDREEIAAWDETECLALFVQNIASELRLLLGADDHDLSECLARYLSTDWEREPEYPIGAYYRLDSEHVGVEYYTGC